VKALALTLHEKRKVHEIGIILPKMWGKSGIVFTVFCELVPKKENRLY